MYLAGCILHSLRRITVACQHYCVKLFSHSISDIPHVCYSSTPITKYFRYVPSAAEEVVCEKVLTKLHVCQNMNKLLQWCFLELRKNLFCFSFPFFSVKQSSRNGSENVFHGYRYHLVFGCSSYRFSNRE